MSWRALAADSRALPGANRAALAAAMKAVPHNDGVRKRRTPEESRRRGVHLEWATNGWNVMEVVVTISLGCRPARSL